MKAQQQVISADFGKHNANLDAALKRVQHENAWKNLSCIQIVPCGKSLSTRVVASWMNLYSPPNNKFFRMWPEQTEVGAAYSASIEAILAHPDLSKWKYILCMEWDNCPPPDGIVKLLAQMEAHPEFAAIGGLYWTRGETGQSQIWGDPKDPELNFRPQMPVPGKLVECCGTGMGFTVFRLDMFKDPKLRKPWFKTQTEGGVATQDLFFWSDARRHGYRCAVDCSVLVGHLDLETGIMW